jgi:glycosyltransferase involved in cell wall biosynthesis
VLVAHAGKQHAYRHALAVQKAGRLTRFVTSGYYCPQRLPDRWLAGRSRLDALLRRRYLEGLDLGRIARRWDLELPELLGRKLFGNARLAQWLVCLRDARFDRWVARRWAAAGEIYWGFQGSCLQSLRAARAAGKIAVAEFATAHVTLAIRLLAAECERHPEWADSISNFHFPDWYRRRLEQEPHQADYCIAASQFTRQSLLEVGIAAERIKVLPLGADLHEFSPSPRRTDATFRVLFVGGVGQRKGIKYLLEAYRKMRSAATELVIVGPLAGSGKALEQYRGTYTYLGRLDQRGVVEQMRRCHVLVLPSVFEGFGLVVPEAMATGMPVIASTHSIGPEIIHDGEEGFVLEPDDVEGLAAKLAWLAGHRQEAREMGRRGAAQAQSLSWQRHAEQLAVLLEEIAGNHRCAPTEEGLSVCPHR